QHLPRVTSHRVFTIAERLAEEVCKSERLGDPNCPNERAVKLTRDFLGGIPQVRELLKTDVEAAFQGDPAAEASDEVILSYPFIEAIAIQRSAHVLYSLGVPIIPRMMTEWAHSRTGIDIHPGARIGSHFFIDHGTGVVIGETSILGKNVTIYANATIMGGDTVIGAGSTIGASVFLTHSVPPRSLVLAEGQGVRVIEKDKRAAGGGGDDWVI
ncbi:MAG: serine acetyltransferase, partial [Chthoniobacteraceae bacterium]